MNQQDLQFQIESMATELARMLMAEYGWSWEQALDALYRSQTFKKIEDEHAGLFYQSDFYVFQYLKEELDRAHRENAAGAKIQAPLEH